MHGISPISRSLTSTQAQVSAKISEALPDLPTALSDLISEMAVPDFSIATRELELNERGDIIQNEKNQRIVEHIELALTSSSDECHPTYKAQIFVTGSESNQSSRKIKPYLVQIILGLQDSGAQINLDDVELVGLNLERDKPINLSGLSARRASFISVNMQGLRLDRADLTGATFTDTNLKWAHLKNAVITDAVFSSVSFDATLANDITANQSGILKCCEYDSHYGVMDDRNTLYIDSWMFGNNVSAAPDTKKFTLTSKRITS